MVSEEHISLLVFSVRSSISFYTKGGMPVSLRSSGTLLEITISGILKGAFKE